MNNAALKVPLVFHYDTTFNVGTNHFSILTLRDPKREKKAKRRTNSSNDAILRVAVMIHQASLLEQHGAFFRTQEKKVSLTKNVQMGDFISLIFSQVALGPGWLVLYLKLK